MRRLLSLTGLAMIVATWFAWWAGPANARGVDPPVLIDQAELVSAAGRRTVSLPHKLEASDFAPSGQRVRYLLDVELASPDSDPLGVFIPKMSLSGRVWVNGQEIGGCVPGNLEQVRCLHQPQLVIPPPGIWRMGANRIEVEIFASDRQVNGLSQVSIGDADALARGPYRWRTLLQVDLLTAMTWIGVSLALVSLGVAILLRGEPLYLWFGLASLSNAISNVNVMVMAPPVDSDLYSWFVFSSRLVSIPLLYLALLSFFQRGSRWFRWILIASLPVLPMAVGLAENDPVIVARMYLPFMVGAPVMLAFGLAWAIRSRQRRDALMVIALATMVAAGLHDYLRLTNRLPFEGVYLIAYSNAGLMVIMGGLLVNLLVQALQSSRLLAGQLEREVAIREEALRKNYASMLELEQASARFEERDRLLRDMHDGIGSNLSSARVLLESGTIRPDQAAVVLSECIEDMRLIFDASAADEGNLETTLADFRYRLNNRIGPSGLRIRWQIDLAGMPKLATHTVLQLMRILQEAINNALRHAAATRLEILARWVPEQSVLECSVRDDGAGIYAGHSGTRGRGLPNMHRRAASIGAQLEISPAAPGTVVKLILKIDR